MNARTLTLAILVGMPPAALAACGDSAAPPPSVASPDAAPVEGASDASALDVAAESATPEAGDVDPEAAKHAAETDPTCTALGDFYWEIGDAKGITASGAAGTTYTRTSDMDVASASKLVFGAYVVERFKADPTKIDRRAMMMLSGYTSLGYASCLLAKTVQACFDAADNATYTAENADKFFYNGGHFQKYAVDLGLGALDEAGLTTEIQQEVGTDFAFTYSSPQLAAGLHTTAAAYASFLQKILDGRLAIHDALGKDAVCTLPSACPAAVSSPAAPHAWHYSYGHWVEDDPADGDGAFSSPGAFGFYPWIDASKRFYGIVARHVVSATAYIESAMCGAAIRRAFFRSPGR